jgi:hypothetical protein
LFIFIKQANSLSQHRPPIPPGRHATTDAGVGLMHTMLAPERLSPLPSHTLRPVFVQDFLFFFSFSFSVGHNSSMYLSAHQDDVSIMHFSTTMTTSILTSATLTLRGYCMYVVLVGFYSSYNICAIMMLQLWWDVNSLDSTFDLVSSLTVCGAPTVTAGDVRVYMVDYILCIIDCLICRDIFGRIILCIVYYHMYPEVSCP